MGFFSSIQKGYRYLNQPMQFTYFHVVVGLGKYIPWIQPKLSDTYPLQKKLQTVLAERLKEFNVNGEKDIIFSENIDQSLLLELCKTPFLIGYDPSQNKLLRVRLAVEETMVDAFLPVTQDKKYFVT